MKKIIAEKSDVFSGLPNFSKLREKNIFLDLLFKCGAALIILSFILAVISPSIVDIRIDTLHPGVFTVCGSFIVIGVALILQYIAYRKDANKMLLGVSAIGIGSCALCFVYLVKDPNTGTWTVIAVAIIFSLSVLLGIIASMRK